MSKAILFNGPPGCGKDTAVRHLHRFFKADRVLLPVEPRKFATHVKEGTHATLGLFDGFGRPLPHDAFELVKNEPRDEFAGMTPRQAYIWFSEEVMKPKFGKGIFGEIEARKIAHEGHSLYLFSDSGFAEEAREIVKVLGCRNVFLVNIVRPGHTFEGDSRDYIRSADIGISPENHYAVSNSSTESGFLDLIEKLAVEILDR
jgi:hypothetical protein